jgi:hypothetical protein
MGDTNEQGMVQPSNKIVVDSTNLHLQTKKIETVANVYPGVLLMQGTNDDDVVVCDGTQGKAAYWAGYEHTAKKYRPATIDTIYVVNDQIGAINGPGIILVARLLSGQTVAKHDRLCATGAAGHLSGAVVGTDEIVAIAEESKASTAALTKILVRSLI